MAEAFIPSVCVRADTWSMLPPNKAHLAVNGMSYQARDSRNANSAMIVTVTPEDFPGKGCILAGVEFQRKLERAA